MVLFLGCPWEHTQGLSSLQSKQILCKCQPILHTHSAPLSTPPTFHHLLLLTLVSVHLDQSSPSRISENKLRLFSRAAQCPRQKKKGEYVQRLLAVMELCLHSTHFLSSCGVLCSEHFQSLVMCLCIICHTLPQVPYKDRAVSCPNLARLKKITHTPCLV